MLRVMGEDGSRVKDWLRAVGSEDALMHKAERPSNYHF